MCRNPELSVAIPSTEIACRSRDKLYRLRDQRWVPKQGPVPEPRSRDQAGTTPGPRRLLGVRVWNLRIPAVMEQQSGGVELLCDLVQRGVEPHPGAEQLVHAGHELVLYGIAEIHARNEPAQGFSQLADGTQQYDSIDGDPATEGHRCTGSTHRVRDDRADGSHALRDGLDHFRELEQVRKRSATPAVRRRIHRDRPETGLDKRLNERSEMGRAAAPSVHQQNRPATAPRVCAKRQISIRNRELLCGVQKPLLTNALLAPGGRSEPFPPRLVDRHAVPYGGGWAHVVCPSTRRG